jgi:hypothetical protein
MTSSKTENSVLVTGGSGLVGEKAKRILGWKPRTNEEAIMASVESMARFGSIKKSKE